MPGPHDMGGDPAGPIDLTEHIQGDFERRMDAVVTLLGGAGKRVMRVDELRRAIESLPDYNSLTYYQKWAKAIKRLNSRKNQGLRRCAGEHGDWRAGGSKRCLQSKL